MGRLLNFVLIMMNLVGLLTVCRKAGMLTSKRPVQTQLGIRKNLLPSAMNTFGLVTDLLVHAHSHRHVFSLFARKHLAATKVVGDDGRCDDRRDSPRRRDTFGPKMA